MKDKQEIKFINNMGIKQLHKLLRKHCPEVYVTQPLSAYRYKKLAIDASLYMFKYKTSAGDRWLSCFVSLIAALRRNEIHAMFCFDNGAPIEKQQERATRQDARQKIKTKAEEIEDALREFDLSGEVGGCLRDLMDKSTVTKERKLLGTSGGRSNTNRFDRKIAETELKRLQNQSISISTEDFVLLKQLCTIMNVPIVEAPDEAEKKCSELCIGESIYGVITEDTDVLCYGCPVFLTSIQYHKSECIEIAIQDVLDCLDLTYESFRDLCIMCGTDYNKNIFKICPEKAYALIRKYKNIETIQEETDLDTSILNHVRSRELFTAIPDTTEVSFCKIPDFNKLDMFLFENNSKVDVSGLKKSFMQHDMIFD